MAKATELTRSGKLEEASAMIQSLLKGSEPDPDPSTAMRWVYAEEWPSEGPPPWGLGGGHGMECHGGPDDRSAAEGATD